MDADMTEDKGKSDLELVSVVSYLYYYEDMNQSEIANRLFLSRSTVSRLLKKAKASGVVEMKINEPWQRDLTMEDTLKTLFPIDSVRVLKVSEQIGQEDALTKLGQMTSFYISCNVKKHHVLGLSWGNTISHVIDTISGSRNIPFTVTSIMGSRSWPRTDESYQLSLRFSRIYGARYVPLEAPLYASTPEEYEAMISSPRIQEALELARQSDIILTSVSSIEKGQSLERMIGPQRLARLKDLGCVGRLGGHFYDINGCEIEGNYKELHIGLTMEEGRGIGNVICVAAAPEKSAAIYGAMRAKLPDTLIITAPVAKKLIEIAAQRRLD